MMHMLAAHLLIVFLFAADSPEAVTAPAQIVIDGEFDDWRTIQSILIDPADAPDSAVDFGEVRVTATASHVHLLIDFGRTVNAQGLDGHAMILLNVDGDATTGTVEYGLPGVDVIADLSPPSPRAFAQGMPGLGMGVRSTTYRPDPADPAARRLTVYDIGLLFAPTHAGRRMEFAIERGVHLPNTPPLFEGVQFSGKLVFINLGGTLADETDAFTIELPPREINAVIVEQHDDPLARNDADLRIMTWNVERGAMFTNPHPFMRTIKALQPDVILLQELPETNSAQQVQTFLTQAFGETERGSWQVIFGEGGGNLRCAIASRFQVRVVPALQNVPMGDRPAPPRTLRAVGAIISHNDSHILAISAHLKCCGRAGGPEDFTRIEEVNTLNVAIRRVQDELQIDAVVIGGDLNLVGSRDPLELLATAMDCDRSALAIAPAYWLNGFANATWADPKQPFAPGRLDFLLYSDSQWNLVRSFVYDPRHLSKHWIDHHRVHRDDVDEASDHKPVILDVSWLRSELQSCEDSGE